ncbi:MAG: SpoIIE family protein phosphatase, partial [Candidatus Eremiobacteraeota bacterium]|nr:SpoIIE family protein phosphatase [Candidatus Eremiobacteraeota bacterium]
AIGGGALLVLYTDGVTEATRDAIAGEALLRSVLESEMAARVENPARYIERAVAREQRSDDVAIMTLRFAGDDDELVAPDDRERARVERLLHPTVDAGPHGIALFGEAVGTT